MIKFFRTIRQNFLNQGKTSKYLKYAIGEIVLVVIGILIALSINNWNQKNSQQETVKSFMGSLISDLQNDIHEAEDRIIMMGHSIERIDNYLNYVRTKRIEEFDNLDLFMFTKVPFGYKPPEWFRSTIEEMKSSGSFNYISNDSIKLKSNAYYSLADHLDQDYLNDLARRELPDQLLREGINYNYPNFEELDSIITKMRMPKEERLLDEDYILATELNYQLLVTDVKLYKKIANHLLIVREALETRMKFEYPKLIQLAEALIELLEQEYRN